MWKILPLRTLIPASLAMLAACNDTGRQLRLASEGSSEFWRRYNDAAFGEIYDHSSDYIHRKLTRQRWTEECAALQARLGQCRNFTTRRNNEYPFGQVGIVWVRGTASCDRAAEADIRLDWDISSGHPMLFNVQLESQGAVMASIPGFSAP